ncbi:hypothetical protein [Streptomyces sp. NPDC088254]|uniref:hypothetical protein n=1 Tax=Streptomyces sp. NPDC088254 TaxID=3365847 RepID=UPI0038110157
MVRISIETEDGFTEHHYARIEQFRKRDGNWYRRKPTKPYAAFLEPDHASTQVIPLAELTAAVEDFEIITDHSEIHKDAREWNDFYFKCLRCGGYTYKGAEVMVIHKLSRQLVRLCNDCYEPEELARLGHQVLWYQRNCKTTILELRANPELITGPTGDPFSSYDKTDADVYREFADTFPWLVPAKAAEVYAAWKEQHSAGTAA